MNFNIYVNKKIGEEITNIAAASHRSRNSIVTEALELWLKQQRCSKWPENFFDFSPIEEVPDFKAYRQELNEVSEDPLV